MYWLAKLNQISLLVEVMSHTMDTFYFYCGKPNCPNIHFCST